jgi:hypothetical protein
MYNMAQCKKAMSECAKLDVDIGDAEPKDVGVGIFRPPRCLVCATIVHIRISHNFFSRA